MHVLQICGSVDQNQGGAPCSTVGAFLSMLEAGVDTSIIALGESRNTFSKIGFLPQMPQEIFSRMFLVTRRNQNLHGHILRPLEVRKFLEKVKYSNVIISHQVYGLQSFYVFLAHILFRKHYVVMPHGSLTIYDQEHHKYRKSILNFLFIKHYLRKASAIFVATRQESREIEKQFDFCDIRIVGLGFPEIAKMGPAYRSKNKKAPVFLFMGRVTQKKRLDLTIRAFAQFADSNPGSKLIIAGDGDSSIFNQCIQIIIELKLEKLVEFRGWVSGLAKTNTINECDFFVLNSEDENFAVIVAEVQSIGMPVLLSSRVAFSEYVREYKSGVVIEDLKVDSIHSGMKKLMEKDFETMSHQSILCASSTTWPKVIEKWLVELRNISNSSMPINRIDNQK